MVILVHQLEKWRLTISFERILCERPRSMQNQPGKIGNSAQNLSLLLKQRCTDLFLHLFDGCFTVTQTAMRILGRVSRNRLELSCPDNSILQRDLCWLLFLRRRRVEMVMEGSLLARFDT